MRRRLNESDLNAIVTKVVRGVVNEALNPPLNQTVNINGLVKGNPQIEPAVDELIEFCSEAFTVSRNWSNDDETTILYLNGLECLRDIKRRLNTDM